MSNKVELYNITQDEDNSFILRAFLNLDGSLTLEGQDFCTLAKDLYGDEEYEYYYIFDLENTNKLKILFETDNLLESLKRYFKNKMLLIEFREFCDSNNIVYNVHIIWKLSFVNYLHMSCMDWLFI